jgi:5-carboxymethyl-2-hydroxymuconate isomerase
MFMSEPICRVKARNRALKLATFSTGGRTSYGAVVGDGIVDLGPRLKHLSLLDVLRAGALDEARGAAVAAPDIALEDVTLLPPVVAPEKILCIGVNYANRNAEYRDGSEQPKYPSMFFRTPGSLTVTGSRSYGRRRRRSSTMKARSAS